jgi:hypothetical protein
MINEAQIYCSDWRDKHETYVYFKSLPLSDGIVEHPYSDRHIVKEVTSSPCPKNGVICWHRTVLSAASIERSIKRKRMTFVLI